MTGLLQRVAARATGNAAAVRSDARLSPAALRPIVAGIEPMQTVSEAGHGLAPPPLDMAPARNTPRRDLDPFTGDPAPGPIQEQHHRPATQHIRTPADLDPTHVRPAPIVPVHADLAVNRTHVHTTHVQRTIETAEREVRIRERFADQADAPVRDRRDPPLMLPLRDALRSSAPPMTVASGTARSASGASSAERDVHIYIGSVEVTAVHDTAPAPRRPPASPPPMSLEAYFARRGRT